MGFGIPVSRWLAGRWYESTRDIWQDSIAQREGWANARSILKQLKESKSAGVVPLQLWYLLVLELWLRHEQTSMQSIVGKCSVAASN